MKVEEFKVTIKREGRFFVALIDFPDGKQLATQGENIFECYDMIADILKAKEEDAETVD
jgi:hypothetical protein